MKLIPFPLEVLAMIKFGLLGSKGMALKILSNSSTEFPFISFTEKPKALKTVPLLVNYTCIALDTKKSWAYFFFDYNY